MRMYRVTMRRKGAGMKPLHVKSVGRGSLASSQFFAGEALPIAAVLVVGKSVVLVVFRCFLLYFVIGFPLFCYLFVTAPFSLASDNQTTYTPSC